MECENITQIPGSVKLKQTFKYEIFVFCYPSPNTI